MNKKLLLYIIIFIYSAPTLLAGDLSGFWCTYDKKTRQPTSVIAVYPYKGKFYGKIVATYNKQGVLSETLKNPKTRAPGMAGNPYYCGLDFIWVSSTESKGKHVGQVVDPESGKKYSAKLWKENGNLVLRGELMMFGRSEILYPYPPQNFNSNFEKPDINALVPEIHQTKN